MAENNPNDQLVTITIKVLGSENRHQLTVPLSMTISELKDKVVEFSNFEKESIRLIFMGKSLQNKETLSFYKIEDGHTILAHASRKSSQDNQADDPPPPTISQAPRIPPPNPPSSNPNEPNLLPQTPNLPPLPRNPVADVKKELSGIQRELAILLNDAANMQLQLTTTNADEINQSIRKYLTDCNSLIQSTRLKINNIRNVRFTTNNNRVEVDPQASNSNDSRQNDFQTPRPVVDDIFTPSERADIQSQITSLDQYVNTHELDENYKSSDLYKSLH